MTATFEIRRFGSDWILTSGAAVTHLRKPARGVVEDAVTKWQSAEGNPMRITTAEAYTAAAARIQSLSDAKEGSPQAEELAELIAAVRQWDARKSSLGQGDASAPGNTRTAQRPGQPGAADETRAGPNPRSPHPTGAHPPFARGDTESFAAAKHEADPAESSGDALPAGRRSAMIRSIRKT